LRDLRNQLSASRLTLVNTYDAEKDRNNSLNEEYETLITSLNDTTIPQVLEGIENNQSIIVSFIT